MEKMADARFDFLALLGRTMGGLGSDMNVNCDDEYLWPMGTVGLVSVGSDMGWVPQEWTDSEVSDMLAMAVERSRSKNRSGSSMPVSLAAVASWASRSSSLWPSGSSRASCR